MTSWHGSPGAGWEIRYKERSETLRTTHTTYRHTHCKVIQSHLDRYSFEKEKKKRKRAVWVTVSHNARDINRTGELGFSQESFTSSVAASRHDCVETTTHEQLSACSKARTELSRSLRRPRSHRALSTLASLCVSPLKRVARIVSATSWKLCQWRLRCRGRCWRAPCERRSVADSDAIERVSRIDFSCNDRSSVLKHVQVHFSRWTLPRTRRCVLAKEKQTNERTKERKNEKKREKESKK